MCVIAVCEHARLTDEQVNLMWEANKFGGGVAWRDKDSDGRDVVKWEKGLTREQMVEFNKTLPLPYVLHFRIPSTGTSQSYLACHPFQIDENATIGFEGQAPPREGDAVRETTGYVLFHNGFWSQWKDKLQTIAFNGYRFLPGGPWSDSRGLAWAAHHLGFGLLEMIDERVVCFGPGEFDIEVFGSWSVIKNPDENGEEQKILVSNKSWEKSTPPYYTGGGRHHQHGGSQGQGASGSSTPVLVRDHRRVQGVLPAPPAENVESMQAGGPDAAGVSFRGTEGNSGGKATDGSAVQEQVQEGSEEAGSGSNQAVRGAVEGADSLKKKCHGCKKPTRSGNIFNSLWFCWQCWAERTQHINNAKPFIGTCSVCRVNSSSAKLVETDKWICNTCWETNNKPKIRFLTKSDGQVTSLEI